jgi:hypothetical protein
MILTFYQPIILAKFKVLGFIHPNKNRPVGNVKYLNLTDVVIISNFSYLYFIILIWFLDANNFSALRSFVKILKQSCILTLSRKHNKSKFWVNSIYTNNILVLKNLFTSYNSFPSINFLLGYLDSYQILLVDEAFFLVD